MDDLNKKIYGKIVVLLNTFGYNKKNLSNIKKDELKPILKEVYNEFDACVEQCKVDNVSSSLVDFCIREKCEVLKND